MIEREQIDNIRVLRLANGKANAFNLEFLAALDDALDEAVKDGTRAIVLTARGSIFSAGVDLLQLTTGGVDYIGRFLPPLSATFRKLFLAPLPVVAAVNGHAIAGGCILAESCDYRIMSSGKIGVAELLVGVAFPPLALEVVRFAVAPEHFQKLVLNSMLVPSSEAAQYGLIDEAVEPERLMERALEVARALATVPREAFRVTKQQLRQETLDRAERFEGLFGDRIDAIWKTEETLATIRAYVERTMGRKS